MDDTILNKIEYSNDPKEINEEKIIAYQNNDGLKVDDIIVNQLVLNYVMITVLKIKFKTILDETHYYLDNPSNLSQKKMLENIAANFILSNGRL
ncbi:unnamed protein product [Rhizophagus irregularis]|uniref:Uncharacterized protein n=1 Tax=Rhizophagus irregularis TaxID=588596 RepID=A0A916EKB9_9GLOM|nr:unnamed protein product [Rhizophagus irregularis]